MQSIYHFKTWDQSINKAWDLGTSVYSINYLALKIVKIKFKPFKKDIRNENSAMW